MPIYSANKTYLEFDLIENKYGIVTEGFKFIKDKDVPDDFKGFAIKVIDGARSLNNSKNEKFGVKLEKVKSKIEKQGKKSLYVISIGDGMDTDSFIKFLGNTCKAQGMKKSKNDPKASYTSYTKKGKGCIYVVDGFKLNPDHIYIRCLEDSQENKDIISEGVKMIIESDNEVGGNASSDRYAHNHSKEDLTPNSVGFAGLTPEELYGFTPELGLTRSEDLVDSDYGDFFKDPKVMKAFTENFDLKDRMTRKAIIAMNEADQTSVLTALTSKLYDNIVTKVDDIDYGEIPSTKGDITKLSNYKRLVDCVELLRNILKEFKQDTAPIDEISVAISNVSAHKDTFMKAYRMNCELPIIMYNNTVLSIINAVSYMIATSIEFMKTPNQDSFTVTLDRVSYAKTKNNMIYNNLKKFNKSVKSGDFDKAMDHIIKNRVKGFHEAAVGTVVAAIGGITGLIAIITHIIPILREMVFFFYYTRMRVSDFFDVQADLLQMNAYNVENSLDKDEEQKERIVSKQLKIVELFRKIANKISFTCKKAEVDATKEISKSSKKMKLDDVTDELPDSVSVLF